MFLCFDNHISKHWRLCRLYVRRADTNGFINIYSSTLSNLLVNLNLQVTKREGVGSRKMIFKYCLCWATSGRRQENLSKVGSLPGGGRSSLRWRGTETPVLEKNKSDGEERAQVDLFQGWG